MFSNKMDLRVSIITFLLNSNKQLYTNLIDGFFNSCGSCNKEIYKIAGSRCKIHNYDEVNLLMNKYHNKYECIKNNKGNYGYYYYLIRQIADSFISHRDGKIILKYWEHRKNNKTLVDKKDEPDKDFLEEYDGLNKIAMWNTLSREIDTDILVFQYMIDNDMDDYRYLKYYHSIVHIEDLQLERVLSKGVAETHMHLNAGINFEMKWHNLMNQENYKWKNYELLEISTGEGIDNEDLKKYRYICIIYRIVLSTYIFSTKTDCFKKFIFTNNNKYGIKGYTLRTIIEKIMRFDSDELRKLMEDIKFYMNAHQNKDINYEEKNKYSRYMKDTDFLYGIINNINLDIETSLENIFIFESLKYVKDKGKEDELFSEIFYKYILMKNIFFRISTQNNFIKGLDRFTKSFKRSVYLEKEINKLYLILHIQTQNRNIKKLEIRSSFPNEKSKGKIKREIKKGLVKFFEIYEDLINYEFEDERIPQIGIVYHFKKEKDEDEKCWIDNIYYNDNTRLYYETHRKKYLLQLTTLNEVINDIPKLSKYIVGIDAASIESNTDPWVFAPIFRKARSSHTKIGSLKKNDGYINTLGFTFHVGEEFRHILSGLRHIYEVIEHFNFKSGDRIGHGIALGVDIDNWYKNNSIVILPRFEYLENLLWVWDLLTKQKSDYNVDINYIERKIIELAREIYLKEDESDLKGLNVYMLYDAYISKFDENKINDKYIQSMEDNEYCGSGCVANVFCQNVNNIHRQSWDKEKIAHSKHCEQYLRKMKEPIEVVIDEEDLELFKFIQNEVKKKVSREGIIIETNPTSNRSIGELDSIFEHYINNLNNVDKYDDDNIMVSINTDDPCVFNTNINNEYAYIFYSLLKKGYDRNTCLEWIDKIRSIAIEQSFIKTRKISKKEELSDEIDEIIKKLR